MEVRVVAVITVDSGRPGSAAELEHCRALEVGNILLFPRTPFELPEADRAFLLTQRQVGAGYHKNIAYRPQSDRVTGFVKRGGGDAERLRRGVRRYSPPRVEATAALPPPHPRPAGP